MNILNRRNVHPRKDSKSPQRDHSSSNGNSAKFSKDSQSGNHHSSWQPILTIGMILSLVIGSLNLIEVRNLRTLYESIMNDPDDLLMQAAKDELVDSQSQSDKPRVWIQGKRLESGYLIHVMEMFEKLGYDLVNGSESAWDVLWSHEYPFRKDILPVDLEPHQRVNHFPGSGFITNKVSLATSGLRHIPRAFHLPKDKDTFLAYAKDHPDQLWVKKSNDHRGIRVQNVQDMNLTTPGTFVQEFIHNPLLIDGKKFDIGVYVTMTSVNPLRVYTFNSDLLLRFCAKQYLDKDGKFNSSDVDSYVVGDDYTPIWEIPSLKPLFTETKTNMKQTLATYLKSIGKDPDLLWQKIEDSIASVYLAKADLMGKMSSGFDTSRHFFEMVRFDFVVDENLDIYLMEANMSPNLSSQHFAPNKLLYEQVIYNLLSLTGIANTLHVHNWMDRSEKEWNLMVNDNDLLVYPEICSSKSCHLSCQDEKCRVCLFCLDSNSRTVLKDATIEHLSKWNNKRLIPSSRQPQMKGDIDAIQSLWFQGKCLQDISWCA